MTNPIKSARTLGLAGLLAAVAMLVVASVGVASASAALPEFVPKGGKFPVAFESKSTESSILETVKERVVKCTGHTSSGSITGPQSGTATVKFTGCTTTKSLVTLKCKSAGAKEEEIIVNADSKLVYTDEATKEVSELLTPESGTTFVAFECTGLVKEVLTVREHGEGGGVLGLITPPNKLASTFTLAFTQSKGIQKSSTKYFESGVEKEAYLETEGKGTGLGSETFAFEQSAQQSTDAIELAGGEEGEIKA